MKKLETVVTVISKISDRPVSRNAALVVIYGSDLGRKYDLSGEQTIIGRSSQADIQIDEESISRNHAKLTHSDQTVRICDLESTNGTFINDEPVTELLPLRNGDFVKIGRTIFKFIAGNNIEAVYHDEIYRLTTVDGLTQIFNRRYFEETLEREVSRCVRYGRALSLLMLDIDRFKQINDTYGHLAGDHVLKQLSSSVKTKIRREDIFARYGGEEFALLLPEIDETNARKLAEKLRRLVEGTKFEFDKQPITVTLSIGLASMSPGRQEGAELVRSADEKLYEAKTGGRNRVCG